jgi:polyphosphate kinase
VHRFVNLDEFFEIRVAGLKEQLKLGSHAVGADGIAATGGIPPRDRTGARVDRRTVRAAQRRHPSGAGKGGIAFFRRSLWSEEQRAWIREFFVSEVMPVLTPIGLDPSHPFPRVLNKSLNFAVELEGTDAFGRNSGAAIVQAPRALPRVIRLPEGTLRCRLRLRLPLVDPP